MTAAPNRPVLRSLRVTDPVERWQALGFTVQERRLQLGQVTLELGPIGTLAGCPGEIVSWGLAGIDPVASIGGLATEVVKPSPPADSARHPNGAVGIDHVVVTTPGFDRTAAALEQVGLALRRVRQLPGGGRQGFRRLGQVILELVEITDAPDPSAPARFWGLVVVVQDLEALVLGLGEKLTPPKAAVQPGRCIATLRAAARLGPAVAFMSPQPD